MTFRFGDSFDHYATADILTKWSSKSGGPLIVAGGRRGGKCISLAVSNYVAKTLDNQITWVLGMAVYVTTYPPGTGVFIGVFDGASEQVVVTLNAMGNVSVYRGNKTTLLGTSVNSVPLNSWFYFEFKVKIDNAVGTAEVKVNGSNVGWINLINQDTQSTANAFANVLQFGSSSVTSAVFLLDDLYICDTQGANNNDFLGDLRGDATYPNGIGNYTEWANSGGAGDNYTYVDDANPDGDATYVYDDTVGHRDSYGFSDISHDPQVIFAVQINMCVKKDDSGAREICSLTRSAGVDHDGASRVMSTSYMNLIEIEQYDPNTSALWTKAGLNAAEFGIKVTA